MFDALIQGLTLYWCERDGKLCTRTASESRKIHQARFTPTCARVPARVPFKHYSLVVVPLQFAYGWYPPFAFDFIVEMLFILGTDWTLLRHHNLLKR